MKRTGVYILCLLCVFMLAACATRPKPPRGVRPVERTMTTTGYCDCQKCCNWKRNWLFRPVIASGPSKGKPKDVGITASGSKAKPGTVAADTGRYPFGTVVHVPGYGYGRVEDRGSAVRGEHLDLFFKSHKEALKWGRRTSRVTVWLPAD
jgi:3D (Asp-Asp-Asp) domain-containing protein